MQYSPYYVCFFFRLLSPISLLTLVRYHGFNKEICKFIIAQNAKMFSYPKFSCLIFADAIFIVKIIENSNKYTLRANAKMQRG